MNSIQQPYEVIETEETVTRYFNRHSDEPTFCTNNEAQTSLKNNHQECPERNSSCDELIIVLRDGQFQALYEKFNKLRMVMSELTEKFKEINLMKEETNRHLPSPAVNDIDICVDICNDLNFKCVPKKQMQPKLEQANNVFKDCDSPVSVESQTDQIDLKSSNINRILDEKLKCRNRTEASLLRQSKKLLISLIDKELQNVQSGRATLPVRKSLVNVPASHAKQLKMKCIDIIKEELAVLKDLEGIHG